MQIRAVQREARADIAPQDCQIDVGQHAAPVVTQALTWDERRTIRDC